MPAIELSHGSTEYELQGPVSGPLVVLLHGGTIPLFTWDKIVPALVSAGYRSLRYDMYGKGRSAVPDVACDRALFEAQLAELLLALDVREPFHLVGFSFGGATAAHFTARRPQQVRSLALVSPVVRFDEGNTMVRIARWPLVGGAFVRRVVLPKALERASRLWAGAEDSARYAAEFQAQLGRPGYAASLLSLLHGDALRDYEPVYRELGPSRRPTLLVWGSDDEDIPARHIEAIRALMPFVEYHELPGIPHGVVFQAVPQLTRLLLSHLAQGARA